MQRIFRVVLTMVVACLLLQIPMGADAKEAVRIKPGMAKNATGVVKTAKPDLIVSKINYSPGKPVIGNEITLWVFIKNVGRGRADATGARIKVGGESHPPVVTVPALKPGQEWRYTKKFTMNRAGNYIVTITADARNQLIEANEGNNTNTAKISVKRGARPDLVISKINFSPGNPTVNDDITFWVFVKNAGAGPSAASKLRFRIGGESNPATVSVPALPPGKEYRYTRKAKLRKAQSYVVKATADSAKNVAESNESNNVDSKRVTVIVPPMPQGVNVHIKSVTWNRSTKTWVATVRNDGSATEEIGIVGFPLENGAAGMTVWSNMHLTPHQERRLTGDYSSFEVPPGTRLKVRVRLKAYGIDIEKIIVMN